jgi:hypothetical protein
MGRARWSTGLAASASGKRLRGGAASGAMGRDRVPLETGLTGQK